MKHLPSDFANLIPILINLWRTLHRLPKGPLDRLQTREFQSLIESIQNQKKTGHFETPSDMGAYLMYDWLLHYAQGLSLIEELPFAPSRVLEIEGKAAPFSLAALRHGARTALAVDKNEKLLEYGSHITGHYGFPLSIRPYNCEKKSLPERGPWDLIIFAHSAFALHQNDEERKDYLNFLMHNLSETGVLLLVDSSEEKENRRMLSLRDFFVEKNFGIQAPCIWKGPCPLLEHGKNLCYAQRPLEKPALIKDIQRLVGINLSSLKMSYLIVSPKKTPACESKNYYRVISPPVQTFWGDRHYLCGTDGKKTLGITAKQTPKSARAYDFLKRGDVISISHAKEEKSDMQITENTSVVLEAAVAKPFTETIENDIKNMFTSNW